MTKAGASYCIISALVILVVYTGISPAQQPCVLWENDLFDENRITDYPGYHVFLYPLISDVIGDVAPEIITGLQYGGYAVLYVLDGRSGSIIWEDRLGGGMYHSIAVVDDGDAYKKIVVGTKDHHLYVFNARTGELLNTIDHGNKIRIISAADINGDGVSDYAVIGDWLNVALYDGRTWEKTWDHVSKIEIDEVSIDDIDQDGSMEVIALCNRNQVLVSDALTGEIEWMHDLGTRKVMIFLNAPNIASAHGIATVYGKKNLFVGTGCGDILALDGKTGTVLHQKKEHAGYITNLSVGDLNGDGISDVVLSSTDHKVYAVNGRRLEEMWEFKTGDEVYSSPALGDMDNDGLPDVVVVSDDDRAYCIDGQDGKLIWEYEIGVDCNAGHPLLADVNADGLVDVVVDGTMYGGDLVVLKTDAKCTENAILWPKVYGNNRNTGSCGER